MLFAKYIPVKGEIKEGDIFIHPDNTVERASRDLDGRGLQKVELFCCSRDIQIGDKFYLDKENNFKTGEYILENEEDASYSYEGKEYINHIWNLSNKFNTKELVKSNWYKIVGKISSKATWVKENDEFDESEINLTIKDNGSIVVDLDSMTNFPVYADKNNSKNS